MEPLCVNFIFFVAIITLCISQGSSITCYSCSYTYTGARIGEECLYAPMNVTTANIVGCNTKCYSRVVYRKEEEEHRVNSAVRGCWTESVYEMYSECTSSIYERTCTRSCLGEKCNTWNLYYIKPGTENDPTDKDKPENEQENRTGMVNETNPETASSNTTLFSPGSRNCFSALLVVTTIILSFIVYI